VQKKYRIIGASEPRMESIAKVTGMAKYTTDIFMSGMVYGKILRSPYAHARVTGIDVSEAKKVPGVLGILTFKDIPNVLYNCSGTPPSGLVIKDEKILTNESKYVGDKVAAVVAQSEKTCDEALKKIKVDYELLPAIFKIKEALAKGAPLVHSSLFKSNICKTIRAEEGNVEQGLKEADYIFEETYRTQAVQHVSMEPTGCVCHYTLDNRIVVWGTTQTPHHDRRILADLTGLLENRIRVIKPVMGGGFGSRQQLHHQPIGVFLSKLVRRPVKMIYDREEEMYASAIRHPSLIKVRAGVNREGRILAFHLQVYLNTGGYATQGPIVLAAMSRKMQYKVPHYLFEGFCVYTNAPVAGAMRGYGNPQINFARETILNEICEKKGWDPIDFRLKNHLQVGDRIPSLDYTVQSCKIEECAQKANNIMNILEKEYCSKDTKIFNNTAIKRAWGISFGSHSSGISGRDQAAAVVLVNDDGTVKLLVGSPDIGQGSDTILAQIVAEELGLKTTQMVTTVSADTEYVPYDTGTFSSRQAYVGGNAVLKAAQDCKNTIMEQLSLLYGVEAKKVYFVDGKYVVNTPRGEECLDFAEVIRKASFGIGGRVFIGRADYKPSTSPPPFAVCIAEVEVNLDSGEIKVPNVIMAVDSGTILNPGIVEGQVQGGVSMGVGYALYESMRIDHKFKRPLESDLLFYKVQFAVDSPHIHVCLVDSYEPTGPYGAKSVGELPTVPVAAAIVHGVYKATGYWVRELPVIRNLKIIKEIINI